MSKVIKNDELRDLFVKSNNAAQVCAVFLATQTLAEEKMPDPEVRRTLLDWCLASSSALGAAVTEVVKLQDRLREAETRVKELEGGTVEVFPAAGGESRGPRISLDNPAEGAWFSVPCDPEESEVWEVRYAPGQGFTVTPKPGRTTGPVQVEGGWGLAGLASSVSAAQADPEVQGLVLEAYNRGRVDGRAEGAQAAEAAAGDSEPGEPQARDAGEEAWMHWRAGREAGLSRVLQIMPLAGRELAAFLTKAEPTNQQLRPQVLHIMLQEAENEVRALKDSDWLSLVRYLLGHMPFPALKNTLAQAGVSLHGFDYKL